MGKIIKTNKRNPVKNREMIWGFAFLLPSLLGTAVFMLIPFLDTVKRAFSTPVGGFAWFNNFVSVVKNEAFQMASLNTLKFITVCVPLLITLSLLLALLLSHKRMQSATLRSAFLLPMAVPVAAAALVVQLLFNEHGVINGILGLTQNYINTGSAFWVLVGSYLWRNIGYDMVLFLASLSAIPESMYEAAEMDGADTWRRFVDITLPQLAPMLFIIMILSLLNAFKVFREAYLVAGNYPHESIYMLQHLFNNWFFKLDMDKLCAAAVIMAAVLFWIISLLNRLWGRKGGAL